MQNLSPKEIEQLDQFFDKYKSILKYGHKKQGLLGKFSDAAKGYIEDKLLNLGMGGVNDMVKQTSFLTQDDVNQYATDEEKKILNEQKNVVVKEEEKKKREVGDLLLSWEDGDEFEWDDMTDELTSILKRKNKSGEWYAQVKNFGWQGMNGESHLEDLTDGGRFLRKILPDADCIFKIYDFGKNGLAINNFHHDSPTGKEWYYIVPYRYKKDLSESKQLNEKWKDKLQNVYSDFEEFLSYDEIYNLSERLGFSSPEEAWEANPLISGSVNPEEYHALHDNVDAYITDEEKEALLEAEKHNGE